MVCVFPCMTGYYCEEGTSDPTACPPGTFGAAAGLRNVTECTACTAGYYCLTPGLLAEEGRHAYLEKNRKTKLL